MAWRCQNTSEDKINTISREQETPQTELHAGSKRTKSIDLSIWPPSPPRLGPFLFFCPFLSPVFSPQTKLEIMDENAYDREPGTARVSQNYVKLALPSLMPVVLETLSKQDEDSADDLEHWDLGECSKAAECRKGGGGYFSSSKATH